MRRIALAIALAGLAAYLGAATALANASPPTNGGSNLGGGQSGQCTGALADRPASCGPH
jgi:hypothetical protein